MFDSQPDDSLGAEARMEAELDSALAADNGEKGTDDGDGREKYEVTEFVDDAIASGEWSEHLKNEYVYSFKQGGKQVSDLTSSGYFHIALEHRISIIKSSIEKTKTGVMAYAEAERLETGERHPGVAFQFYSDSKGQFDVYCFQKALTKACRNAIKALIPAKMKLAAVKALLALTPAEAKQLTEGKQQPALPAAQETQEASSETQEETPVARALRRGFAVYGNFKQLLGEVGVLEEAFWTAAKAHYKVESRKDMNEGQWNNFISSLEFVNVKTGEMYGKWIRDLIPTPTEDSDAVEEEEEKERPPENMTPVDEVEEDAIPF